MPNRRLEIELLIQYQYQQAQRAVQQAGRSAAQAAAQAAQQASGGRSPYFPANWAFGGPVSQVGGSAATGRGQQQAAMQAAAQSRVVLTGMPGGYQVNLAGFNAA